jgi:hypothetical protein
MSTPCDIAESPSHAQALARSVCAIVFREAVVPEGTHYRLRLDQGRLPIHGTGFLVAPNIVATSLHVVGASAGAFTLVFDFVARAGVAPDRIGPDHVRDALCLVATDAPGFVLLGFDEPIIDREPLALSPHFVAAPDRVFSLGHPAGTPMKYFPPARVVESDPERPVFTTRDLGVTAGNSGSPLFASDPLDGRYPVVGAVNASITATYGVTGGYSLVTAVRTPRLAAAVHAHPPDAVRLGLALS